jgi:hypothetical protein
MDDVYKVIQVFIIGELMPYKVGGQYYNNQLNNPV